MPRGPIEAPDVAYLAWGWAALTRSYRFNSERSLGFVRAEQIVAPERSKVALRSQDLETFLVDRRPVNSTVRGLLFWLARTGGERV